VIFAIVIGGALAGLLGAILALPILAAGRDVFRYLFHRAGSEHPEAVAAHVRRVGMEPVAKEPVGMEPVGMEPAGG